MRAILTDKVTGEQYECTATTDHPDSSYGQAVWVDNDGNALQQVDLPSFLESKYKVEVITESSRELAETEARELVQELIDKQRELGITAYKWAQSSGVTSAVLGRIIRGDNLPTLVTYLQLKRGLGL